MMITSKNNDNLVHIRKLQNSRSFRYDSRQFVGEGEKLFQEALEWSAQVELVVSTKEPEVSLPESTRLITVPESIMKGISQLTTPSSVLFVCHMPEEKEKLSLRGSLVLDGIQDPGNLGTIIRTANALGIPQLVLCPGCADPYNPKVIRSTMGAIFRQRITAMTREELVARALEENVSLVATALSDSAVDIRTIDLRDKAVIIGSEGSGVSQELLGAASAHGVIPMVPGTESMNAAVAASIVMWEMTREKL